MFYAMSLDENSSLYHVLIHFTSLILLDFYLFVVCSITQSINLFSDNSYNLFDYQMMTGNGRLIPGFQKDG